MNIILEYKDFKGELFSVNILPKDYFEEGEIEMDGVPKYLMIEDYVSLDDADIDFVKVTIEDREIGEKRIFSKRFLDRKKESVVCYNEITHNFDVTQELISTIVVATEPRTLLYSRVNVVNGVPNIGHKELIQFNSDGMEEYIKI